ncbi:MAG: helix-turn-helix transcriptional regulator [Deltaproteobacteria bacterium]|nr:helix-turn-helix transcriptional regulator [Deltaproteobacteria bacterium]
MSDAQSSGLFPALLKHWRRQRGLSQLDLAIAADVSARHVSFLETGRSQPSAPMVLRLCASLDVPLRQANAMLRAAGHAAAYPEPGAIDAMPAEVAGAIELLKAHHEPFPVMIVDRAYVLMDLNESARRLLSMVIGDADAIGTNMARLTFDPEGARPAIVNFDEVGRALLWRIQREVLADPDHQPLRELFESLLQMPTVGEDWRRADLGTPSPPVIGVHLRAGDVELRFVTVITAFQAPQTVLLDELRIETWFPSDPQTDAICRQLVP